MDNIEFVRIIGDIGWKNMESPSIHELSKEILS